MGTGLSQHSIEKESWSSPQLVKWEEQVGQQSVMALEAPPFGLVGFWHL